ncbi:MAG: dipeptidase [Anaerolineales bacterium]|jgi:acetylornithine deacetylase/succinyl-diaminopimelate desuccinylase-like protein
MMDEKTLQNKIKDIMPQIQANLARLVAYRSVANTDVEPLQECLNAANDVAESFTKVGVQNVKLIDMPYKHPTVYGYTPPPSGAPTVLLYGHYDVQPSEEESGEWKSPPFSLTERDGRLYGRGAADCKGNVVAHLAALQAYDGEFPVGVRVVIEGSEEQGLGELEGYVEKHPEEFQADAILLADTGNFKLGLPTFTTTLRGMAALTVSVRTLAGSVHSGMFGGPAPDALLALIKMLATLHDKNGNVTIQGLANDQDWSGVEYPPDQFRTDARVLDGVELVGDGGVSSMLWSRIAITVIGIDCPSVSEAANAIPAEAAARISMRVPPGIDSQAAQQALMDHLKAVAPWNVQIEIEPGDPGSPFEANIHGPAYAAMREAMAAAYGSQATTAGQGGSIGLANTLNDASPQAELMLIGVEEPACLIHAPNESVDLKELERHTLSETIFLTKFAEHWKQAGK